MSELSLRLETEAATQALAQTLSNVLQDSKEGLVIWLEGDLGAGKTFFARSLLKALGYAGVVVSPSYTLMEPYDVAGRRLLHLDLYRIADPEELDYLGLYDQFDSTDWVLIEWPDKGAGMTPGADLTLSLQAMDTARSARVSADSQRGLRCLEQLQDLQKIDGDTGKS